MPKFNEKSNKFVEPNLPNEEIGILHLAGGIWLDGKDMREDKNLKVKINTLTRQMTQ